MLLHSHRLQLVATSCTTAVVHYKTQQLQLKSPVATSCGSVGLQFFAVAATGLFKD